MTEADYKDSDYIKVSIPNVRTLAGANVVDVSNRRVFDTGPLDQALATVELRPKAMKPKDWIELQLIVDGGDRPVVSGTFDGQTRPIRDRRDTMSQKLRRWPWIMVVIMSALLTVGIVGQSLYPENPYFYVEPFLIPAGLLAISFFYNAARSLEPRFYGPRK